MTCDGLGILSLHPERECPGCPACVPRECGNCLDESFFELPADCVGCVECGSKTCDGCGIDAPVAFAAEGDVYCERCAAALTSAVRRGIFSAGELGVE